MCFMNWSEMIRSKHFITVDSKQSDDNNLNKKGTGQITEVFQVKGKVFSFRVHVNN